MSHDTNIGAVGDEDHMSFSGPSRRSDGEDFVSRSKLIVLVWDLGSSGKLNYIVSNSKKVWWIKYPWFTTL